MESRITHFSLVINFLDIDFSSNQISEDLKIEIDKLLENFHLPDTKGWIAIFQANYSNSYQLLISKNKLGNYKNDKTKEITIVIPIPFIDKVPWGVNNSQHIYEPSHYDKSISADKYWLLDVNFNDFSNRQDYITDCLRRGIKKAFEEGFTVNGVKVKVK